VLEPRPGSRVPFHDRDGSAADRLLQLEQLARGVPLTALAAVISSFRLHRAIVTTKGCPENGPNEASHHVVCPLSTQASCCFSHKHHAWFRGCPFCISGPASVSPRMASPAHALAKGKKLKILSLSRLVEVKPRVTGRGALTGADAGRWRRIRGLGGAIQSETRLCRWARPCIEASRANQGTGRPRKSGSSPAKEWAAGDATALTGHTAPTLFSPNPGHHASAAVPGRRASKSEAASHARDQ
jgi:hypothetical protein